MKFKMHSEIAILFLTGLCFGQINLANFNSSDVRRGCSVSTNVDSLLLETRVNSGTAVTLITFVQRPDQYFANQDGINGQNLDSIETTLSFRLPRISLQTACGSGSMGNRSRPLSRAILQHQHNTITL